MKLKTGFSIIILCFVLVQALAQIRNPNIGNVRLDFIEGKVSVRYDLHLQKNVAECSIDLLFVDEQYNCIEPKAIKGETGPGIHSGDNKEVTWDYTESQSMLQMRMRPILIQDQSDYFKTHGKGTKSAFYSMIFPGMGDHRVADPGNLIFKPYLRSASSIGLIGTGIIAFKKRIETEAYREYEPGFDYRPVFHPAKTKYWIFPYDAEVFIGIGASIWIADVLWVYAQGRINEKMLRCLRSNDLTINLSPQSCAIGLTF